MRWKIIDAKPQEKKFFVHSMISELSWRQIIAQIFCEMLGLPGPWPFLYHEMVDPSFWREFNTTVHTFAAYSQDEDFILFIYLSRFIYLFIGKANWFLWKSHTALWAYKLNHVNSKSLLTGGNWQKWKRVFLTCPCHKIYRDEAVGLKSYKYTWKITKFVKMWNLGQYHENLIFCQ